MVFVHIDWTTFLRNSNVLGTGGFIPFIFPRFINIQYLHVHAFVSLFMILTGRKLNSIIKKKTHNIPFINIRTQPSVIYMKEHRPKFGLGHVKEFKFNRSSFDNTYMF